jgi:hypothetical protein
MLENSSFKNKAIYVTKAPHFKSSPQTLSMIFRFGGRVHMVSEGEVMGQSLQPLVQLIQVLYPLHRHEIVWIVPG